MVVERVVRRILNSDGCNHVLKIEPKILITSSLLKARDEICVYGKQALCLPLYYICLSKT